MGLACYWYLNKNHFLTKELYYFNGYTKIFVIFGLKLFTVYVLARAWVWVGWCVGVGVCL